MHPDTCHVGSSWNFVLDLKDRHYRPMVFKTRRHLVQCLERKTVLNQTERALTSAEIEILALGLNFVPTRPFRIHPRSSSHQTHRATREGSFLRHISPRLRVRLCSRSRSRYYSQLPALFYSTVDGLLRQTDFYVTEADKGSCVVLWKVEDYRKEAFRQLNDPEKYQFLGKTGKQTTKKPTNAAKADSFLAEHDLLKKLRSARDVLVEKLERCGYMSPEESSAICGVSGSVPYVYFQPKVHQRPSSPDGLLLRGRPVVAASVGPLHLLDKYLARLTAPLVKSTRGSLLNTAQLVERFQSVAERLQFKCTSVLHEPSSAWMGFATADVVSLFSSIAIEDGIRCAVAVYKERYDWLSGGRTTYTCNRNHQYRKPVDPTLFECALRLVVENSYLVFQRQHYYRQLKGVAMGSCVSVFIADCYMYKLTRTVIERPPEWIHLFERYVDDVLLFGCFHPAHGYPFVRHRTNKEEPMRKDPLEMLVESISDTHVRYKVDENIFYYDADADADAYADADADVDVERDRDVRFQKDVRRSSCSFLDIFLKLDRRFEASIASKAYSKPWAAHGYLHRASSHPASTFRNVVFCQLVRMKRLSSSRPEFLKAYRAFSRILLSKGYSPGEIHRSFERVDKLSRFQYAKFRTSSNSRFSGRLGCPVSPAMVRQRVRQLTTLPFSSSFSTTRVPSHPWQLQGGGRLPCLAKMFNVNGRRF